MRTVPRQSGGAADQNQSPNAATDAAGPKEAAWLELLILDFDGVDEADYLKVNREELGLDPSTGAGDWPAGLITHVAGITDAGHGYVVEV